MDKLANFAFTVAIILSFVAAPVVLLVVLDDWQANGWLKVGVAFVCVVTIGSIRDSITVQKMDELYCKLKAALMASSAASMLVYACLGFGGYLLVSCLMPHSSRGSIYYENAPWKVILGIFLVAFGSAGLRFTRGRPDR